MTERYYMQNSQNTTVDLDDSKIYDNIINKNSATDNTKPDSELEFEKPERKISTIIYVIIAIMIILVLIGGFAFFTVF